MKRRERSSASSPEVLKCVYYYSHPSGVEMRGVTHQTSAIVVVANKGISGAVIPRVELDVTGGKYFTTARRTIESAIAVHRAAIAHPLTYAGHLGGLRYGIEVARLRLKALPYNLSCREADALAKPPRRKMPPGTIQRKARP